MIPQPCIEPMPHGDCWRACIASIINRPVATVPNFMAGCMGEVADPGLDLTREWLAQFGFSIFETYCSAKWTLDEVLETFSKVNPNVPIIVTGEPNGFPGEGHAVIAMDGKVVHDPGGMGLAGPYPCRKPGCDCGQTWWFIYTICLTADWREAGQ